MPPLRSPSLSPSCGSCSPWLPPSLNLVLWTDGFFPFGKGSSGLLVNYSLYGPKTTLSLLAGAACSSFSAEAYALLQALLVSAAPTSLPVLFLSDSRCHSVLSSVFPFISNFGLSLLTSRIHSCNFSDWRRTVSSKFFDKQVSSVSIEELVLPPHAHCALSRLRCDEHILLLSFFSIGLRTLHAAPADIRSKTATDSAPLALWRLSGSGLGEFPALWGSMVFGHTPSLGRGQIITRCLEDMS